ncbi:MAG: hypothetical protein LBR34_10785 [Prevotella sp.]|jgi:hypothetical protein|nr:hypothetical protein [Prevotella sp.]
MKKVFTKMSGIALGLLMFSSQTNAQQKTDYTDLLNNPSFEHYMDADKTFIDIANTNDPNIYNSALRITPPGWNEIYIRGGEQIERPVNGSGGINRNAVNKHGSNLAWLSINPMPDDYTMYQDIAVGNGDGELPAGEYIISCRMVVFNSFLTTQRLFAETRKDGVIDQSIVQYFARETDYGLNLTSGETNNYAGWDLTTATSDAESRLKPMSVVITVADGDTLRLGIKTSDWKADDSHQEGQWGFIKMDDFRITRVTDPDPNDYTYKIINPSFELDEYGLPSYVHNLVHRCAGTKDGEYWTKAPYGWSHVVDGFVGESYGENADANNMDGARCCWASCTPFVPYFELYQEITDLPAGKYRVSGKLWVNGNGNNTDASGSLTTQRIFAKTASQNKVQYYGGVLDYWMNLAADEDNDENYAFAGYPTTDQSIQSGLFLRDLSVDIDVLAGETLRIGIKSSNLDVDGNARTNASGWFKADDFRLKKIDDGSAIGKTIADNNGKVEKTAQYYTPTGIAVPSTAKGLLLKKVTYTDGSVNVVKVVK